MKDGLFSGLRRMMTGKSRGRDHRPPPRARTEATGSNVDLSDLGELYHDYAIFGATSAQRRGMYNANQRAKAPILFSYVNYAIAKCRKTVSDEVSFTELFCADGYFAMVARHFGADRVIGVDNDRDGHFALAPVIAKRLGIEGISFVKADINDMSTFERTDIVANLGGLYHMSDPQKILEQSWKLAKRFLLVQTVYSLDHSEPDYFVTPAPNWDWGSRFSLEWLRRRVAGLGGTIVDSHVNELEGNRRPEDRGSAYFLVQKNEPG